MIVSNNRPALSTPSSQPDTFSTLAAQTAAKSGHLLYSFEYFADIIKLSEFDRNWRTSISESAYVVYVATSNRAKAEVLLDNGRRKLLVFNKGGKVMVGGGGTSHYSKPHLARTI